MKNTGDLLAGFLFSLRVSTGQTYLDTSPSPGNPGEGRGEGDFEFQTVLSLEITLTLSLSQRTGRGNQRP